jgi:hypothetical protein
MIRRNARGWTLIELIIVSFLLMVMLTITGSIIAQLSRTTGRTARSSSELALTCRFAAKFRDDVRAARTVKISATKDRVDLTTAAGTVSYLLHVSGRMHRVDGAEIEIGPAVQSVSFSVETPVKDAAHILLAKWLCWAENMPVSDLPAPAGRLLVLDTLLRSAEVQP